MDQTLPHRDALCVMVTEGGTTTLPLEAEGVGSLVTCEDLGGLDADGAPDVLAFGAQLKDRPFSREIVVTNNSRVIQRWFETSPWRSGAAAVAREYLAMISPSGAHKDFRTDKTDGEMGIVFAVEPERVTVHPTTSVAFTLLGVSELEGEILETLVCRNASGAPHERGEVMTVHATASVTVPLLAFSRTEMGFEYSHDPEVDGDLLPRVETRPLTFRNASRTPVTFALRCDPPFSVDKDVWSLEHDEAGTALVRFDPEYRGDRISHEIRTALRVEYVDVPVVDEVFLGAEVRFPNLALDVAEAAFGAVLNDTTERPVRHPAQRRGRAREVRVGLRRPGRRRERRYSRRRRRRPFFGGERRTKRFDPRLRGSLDELCGVAARRARRAPEPPPRTRTTESGDRRTDVDAARGGS